MNSMSRCAVLALAGWIACSNLVLAQGQSLDHIQIRYLQQTADILLSGTSFTLGAEFQASVSIVDRTITITVNPPDVVFPAVVPWALAVPLPLLPDPAFYEIHVQLNKVGEPEPEQIGYLRSWINDPRTRDEIFQSGFE